MMRVIMGLIMIVGLVYANTLSSLYDNVILKNSNNALASAKKLQEDIKANKDTKESFRSLVVHWKMVEAFYILGLLDDEYIDTPRYIDVYHNINEDIHSQLDSIISSSEDVSIALYKNSHKSINALEYIVYKKDISNKRINQIAQYITASIYDNLAKINDGYIKNKANLVSDETKANAIILNTLIDSSYKLKEWRVGDVVGESKKYKSNPDNKRGEYTTSKSSILAIKSILQTYKMILDSNEYQDYGKLIVSYGASDELDTAIKHINTSLHIVDKIQDDDLASAKELYKSTRSLYNTYYISLISKLKITSKIVDADGD